MQARFHWHLGKSENVITLHIYTAVIILDFCLQLYVDVMETLTVLFKCFMSSSDVILC